MSAALAFTRPLLCPYFQDIHYQLHHPLQTRHKALHSRNHQQHLQFKPFIKIDERNPSNRVWQFLHSMEEHIWRQSQSQESNEESIKSNEEPSSKLSTIFVYPMWLFLMVLSRDSDSFSLSDSFVHVSNKGFCAKINEYIINFTNIARHWSR